MNKQYSRPYSNQAEAELDTWNDAPTAEEKLDATPDSALSRDDLTWKKRQGDSQRYIGTLKEEMNQLRRERDLLQEASLTPKRSEALTQMAADHPDLVNVITEAADERLADIKAKMAKLESERDSANLKATQNAATALLLTNHPDAASIVKTDAWYDWLESLPQSVQNEIGDKAPFDGELISYYVGMFKVSTGYGKSKGPQHNQNNNSAAQSVGRSQPSTPDASNKGLPSFKESEIAKMQDAEFTAREAEIMEAYNSGRVFNDMKRD